MCGLNSTGSGYGQIVGFYQHDNEPLGSIKGVKFLGQLSDYQHLKDCSVELVILI
jgi:hypothetical protein